MNNTKTLKDLTDTEIKAIIYDNLVLSENAQKNIKVLNEELANRQSKPVEDPKPIVEEETTSENLK